MTSGLADSPLERWHWWSPSTVTTGDVSVILEDPVAENRIRGSVAAATVSCV